MQVRRPLQNPCHVQLPATATAYDTGVSLHALADQLMAHGRDAIVASYKVEKHGLIFTLKRQGETEQSTLGLGEQT